MLLRIAAPHDDNNIAITAITVHSLVNHHLDKREARSKSCDPQRTIATKTMQSEITNLHGFRPDYRVPCQPLCPLRVNTRVRPLRHHKRRDCL